MSFAWIMFILTAWLTKLFSVAFLFEGDWIPSWHRLRLDPWKHGRTSEVRSGRCHLWRNGSGLCLHESWQSFSRWDRNDFFFPMTKQIRQKIPWRPNQNKMTRWIKMGQIFPNPIFQVFKTPPIWGHVDRNLWANIRTATLGLDAEGQPMKPSKDPLFSCVKPDQETINTVKERWTCLFLEFVLLNSSEVFWVCISQVANSEISLTWNSKLWQTYLFNFGPPKCSSRNSCKFPGEHGQRHDAKEVNDKQLKPMTWTLT